MSDLETKLAAAEGRLAALQVRANASRDKAARVTPGLAEHDPGVLSGIRRKPDHKKDARRFAAYDREAAAWRDLDACEKEVSVLKARIAYAERTKPVPFTQEELKAACAVRTSTGWHTVARVNAKSVTVVTGYTWTDRYTIDKILEVRA